MSEDERTPSSSMQYHLTAAFNSAKQPSGVDNHDCNLTTIDLDLSMESYIAVYIGLHDLSGDLTTDRPHCYTIVPVDRTRRAPLTHSFAVFVLRQLLPTM